MAAPAPAAASPPPAQPAAKPAKPAPREAIGIDLLGPQLLLGGEPAVGLFVLVAAEPAPPPGGAKIEPPKFVLTFVDGQGYLQTVAPGANPWHEIFDQLEELEKLRADKKKPAPHFARNKTKNPHYFKLEEGGTYQVVLVAHPNAAVGAAMLDYLNSDKKDPRFEFPAKDKLIQKLTVAPKDEKGKAANIDLLTDQTKFWPGGSSHYGGWLLYRDMPYGHLPAVRDAVKQLAVDLAKLRYPTSENGNDPYPVQKTEHSGTFSITLMACVHGFQQSVIAGEAFWVLPWAWEAAQGTSEKARGKPKASWAYLLGKKVKLAKDEPPPGGAPTPPASIPPVPGAAPAPAAPPKCKHLFTADQIEWTAVDTRTADAIQEWAKNGLRQPHQILIEVTTGQGDLLWGRPEMTYAIEAWRDLAVALGCLYGIRFGHTFREMSVPAGSGRAECSNHKLGLSVDMRSASHVAWRDSWPIRFEATWQDLKGSGAEAIAKKRLKDAQEALDKAQAKLDKAETDLTKAETDLTNVKKTRDDAEAQDKANKELEANGLPVPKSKVVSKRFLEGMPKVISNAEAARDKALKARNDALKARDDAKAARDGAQSNVDNLQPRVEAAKANYQLLWRLYGHSHFDPYAVEAAKLPEVVTALLAPVEASYKAMLESHFPGTATSEGRAAAVAALIDEPVKDIKRVCDDLLKKAQPSPATGKTDESEGDSELVRRFFRKKVAQFNYNPYEADGGTSGPEITPAQAPLESAAGAYPPDKQPKTWLNLTRIGFECGMWRIPAMRENPSGTFKAEALDPGFGGTVDLWVHHAIKRSSLPGLVWRLGKVGDAYPKEPKMNIRVLAAGGGESTVPLSDFDLDLIKAWSKLIGENDKYPLDLSVELAPKISPAAVLDFLKDGKSKGKKIVVVSVGALVTTLQPGEVAAEELAPLLEGVLTEYEEAKKAEEEAKKAAAADPKNKKKEKERPSKDRRRDQWSVVLRPAFPFADGGSVVLPGGGDAAPMEWWHFDNRAMAGKGWAALGAEIGYSQEMAASPEQPPATLGTGLLLRGLGFKRTDKARGDRAKSTPENAAPRPDGG